MTPRERERIERVVELAYATPCRTKHEVLMRSISLLLRELAKERGRVRRRLKHHVGEYISYQLIDYVLAALSGRKWKR